MASLTRNRSAIPPTTVPNDVNLEYYTQRAKGGAALILTEGTLISRQGTEWPYAPGIWSDEQVLGWKKITDGVHAAGALMFCQVCSVRGSDRVSLTHFVLPSFGTSDASLTRTWRSRKRPER